MRVFQSGRREWDNHAIHLEFEMEGEFSAHEDLLQDDLAQFVKINSPGLLWPYAREYASDQMKRAGIKSAILPIINPREITEQLIEKNLVEILYMKKEGTVEDWKPSETPKK